MGKPPNPDATDPDQHAPGVSETLEKNAAHSRKLWSEDAEQAKQRQGKRGRQRTEPETD